MLTTSRIQKLRQEIAGYQKQIDSVPDRVEAIRRRIERMTEDKKGHADLAAAGDEAELQKFVALDADIRRTQAEADALKRDFVHAVERKMRPAQRELLRLLLDEWPQEAARAESEIAIFIEHFNARDKAVMEMFRLAGALGIKRNLSQLSTLVTLSAQKQVNALQLRAGTVQGQEDARWKDHSARDVTRQVISRALEEISALEETA